MNEAALKSYFMLLLSLLVKEGICKLVVRNGYILTSFSFPVRDSFLRSFMCSNFAWIYRSLSQTEMLQHHANNSVASVK